LSPLFFFSLISVCSCSYSVEGSSFRNVSDSEEVALYLAGKELPPNSPLLAIATEGTYWDFREKMNEDWNYYEDHSVKPIRVWREKWLHGEKHEICFYPFAGADFINAYDFYPHAVTYVLIGLEEAGGIPDLLRLSRRDLARGFDSMVEGYDYLIKWNFYMTLDMATNLDRSPIRGTFPHILSQMAWLGLNPGNIYRVDLDSTGSLKYTKLKKGQYCKSGAIDFTDGEGIKKQVIFLHLNLDNRSLGNSPLWREYLLSLAPAAGILKAASYLPPRNDFSIIRGICLSNMDVLVQDDTAIPYKYFKGYWDITLFGAYHGPHRLFPKYGQDDLMKAYSKAPYIPLEFRYGYRRPDDARTFMLIRRKS
jgi:hypothetical protein